MDRIDRLLTPRELAVYVDVPLTTLYAWLYRGEGPVGFRFGKHLPYRLGDVEEWIREPEFLDPSDAITAVLIIGQSGLRNDVTRVDLIPTAAQQSADARCLN